jgi:hypothetical protein
MQVSLSLSLVSVLLEILNDFLDVGLGSKLAIMMDGVSKSATRFLNSEEAKQILC